MSVTAIILAGGKSSRMGKDKGLISYKRKPLVEHVIHACTEVTSRILINTNNQDYSFLGYKLISDRYIDLGPIGGIQAALEASETKDNIICPCDMPNILAETLKTILDNKKGQMAVVAADPDGKFFPVFGYYNKSALAIIEHQINKGDYKLQNLLKKLDAKTVVVSDLRELSNINYPKDLK